MRQCMGICRWLYNRYLTENIKLNRMYQRGFLDSSQSHFISAIDFDKYVNNKLKVQAQYDFINICGSKARKKAIVNAETALKNFLTGKKKFPQFIKKTDEAVKLYFPKNNKSDWTVERHRIKVPTIGWVRLKEYGYLPPGVKPMNGTVSCIAGRFYVSLTVEHEYSEPVLSGGVALELQLINLPQIEHINNRLIKAKQVLKRKYRLTRYKEKSINKFKQQAIIQHLYQKIEFIRDDFVNKVIASIVEKKPSFVVFPYFNLKLLGTNRSLSEIDLDQRWQRIAFFKKKLMEKCQMMGICIQMQDIENNVYSLNSNLPVITVQIP